MRHSQSNLIFLIKKNYIFLASTYITNTRLNSIAIFYDNPDSDYVRGLEHVLINHNSSSIVLSWFKVTSYGDIEGDIEKLVNLGCQGYITILKDVPFFINQKYEITQTSLQRIRDKMFIFLMEEDDDISALFRMDELDCKYHCFMFIKK